MADSAPPNTLEEDIEKSYHKDVAEFQREHWQMVYNLIEQIDDAVEKVMQAQNLDREAAEAEVHRMLDYHMAQSRRKLEQSIEALQKLRDHRIAELSQWRLTSLEESPPETDTQ